MTNILFLGAAKRVELLKRFKELDTVSNIYSIEKYDEFNFLPIENIATIIHGPDFLSLGIEEFIISICKKYSINVVIPLMDNASLALSKCKETLNNMSVISFVGNYSSTLICTNKILTDIFLRSLNINVPEIVKRYPIGGYPQKFIHKPITGCGSKGIKITEDKNEFDLVFDPSINITQEFIEGVETTVDIYTDANHFKSVFRDRISVSDGEVMSAIVRQPTNKESYTIVKIINALNWFGGLTVQFITDSYGNSFITEINPRIGGGATLAIEAGLPLPELMTFTRRNPIDIKYGMKMTRARQDFFKYEDISN